MQIANCLLRLSQFNEVPKSDVTPAEALVLTKLHERNAQGVVVNNLEIKGDALVFEGKKPRKRSNVEEVERLRKFYGEKVIAQFFPGAVPQLPDRFSEIGLGTPPPPPPPEIKFDDDDKE